MSVSTSMAQDASESETVALSGGGAEDGGEEAIPARIGRYSVIERIGRGGMGSVYRAYDAKLRREVALKQVRADRLGPETELRLVQEAQAMARLSHPNVVAVYDVEVGTSLTLAMEYVPGRSVAQWLEHRRSWREVLEVFVAAGRGLAAAHSVGLVHRDFKPANVLLADDGTTKVTDFGLAKPDDASATGALGEEPPSVDGLPSDSSVPITRADTVMGTPKYMAPEQHSGARADARCDQYAFCVSLWQALTGTHPFDRGSYPELAEAKLAGPPSWPRSPVVPGRIVRAITRGLQPDPRYRHASMSTLLGALEPALAPRRRWWSVGAGVIALGGVIAAAWVGRSERCTGAEAELAGVWDEDASTRVQRALLGHELAYAKSTWSRVQAGLDGYAREWKRLHRDACEAATIRGEQSSAVMDLRMQCLQRAKAELAERVAVLASADAEVLPRAVGMVDDLPALPECADVARLTAESPPPTDPEEAARVDEARAELLRARALATAGKRKEAFAVVEAAHARFADLGYPPVRAELEYQLGDRLQVMARYEESEAALRRALALALEHDVERISVLAARELARVVGYHRAEPEPGLALGEIARSLARRVDPSGVAEADVLDVVGVIRFSTADYAGAAQTHREALALKEAVLGADHHELGALLVNLGMDVEVLGELEEAAALQQRAIALAEAHYGADHPRIATFVLNLGNVRFAQGRYDDAEAAYQRALAILDATYGHEHAAVATTIHNLGLLDEQRGEHERAEARVRDAMAVREALYGREHPEVADSLMMLGVIAEQAGRPEDALPPILEALRIRERVSGPRSHTVGKLRMNLGMVLSKLGRHEEAEAEMQQGLAIKIEVLGSEHAEVGQAWINLASVSRSRGRLQEATARWEAALAILRPALGEEHPTVVHAVNGLAKTRLEAGAREGAREQLEWVLARRSDDQTPPCKRADTELALAEALWPEPSQRPRAHALATAAAERCGADREPEGHAEIEAWLASHSP